MKTDKLLNVLLHALSSPVRQEHSFEKRVGGVGGSERLRAVGGHRGLVHSSCWGWRCRGRNSAEAPCANRHQVWNLGHVGRRHQPNEIVAVNWPLALAA